MAAKTPKSFLSAQLVVVMLTALPLVSSQPEPQCQLPPIRPSSTLHFDVFERILSNHSSIAARLSQAPFVSGVDVNSPAYQFEGNGFTIVDNKVSNAIRSASCGSRELTMYASVFFTDSQSDGPLLDIAYADGLGTSCPAFGLYLDAKADLVTLAYRHLGVLHAESFQTRLHGGKWRKYAVSLSGNLLSLYVNCQFVTSRLVPLPDFCVNDSDVVVSVVDSANREKLRTEFENGLYVYLQDVGFHFGDNGIQQQCPDLPDTCPSCGQFLTLVEQLYELQGEVEVLQTKVSRLERGLDGEANDTGDGGGNGGSPTSSTPAAGGNNCFIDGRTVLDGSFFTPESNEGSVCYCDNGNPVCTSMLDLCPTGTTGSPTATSPPSDTPSGPACNFGDLPGLPVELNENLFLYQNAVDECRVYFCEFRSSLGLTGRTDQFDCMPANLTTYMQCLPSFDQFQQNISTCCRFCDRCDFANCPDNAECIDGGVCQCLPGFEHSDDGQCLDIDECALGRQENGHNCPSLSLCNNTVGSFDCVCEAGYSMEIRSNGDRRCEDNNECLLGTADCPDNSACDNSPPGSFTCRCDPGFRKDDDGNCVAVCDPPCQNGGTCDAPASCTCLRGYTGRRCGSDINECMLGLHDCNHPKSECVNTNGGFFCRCQPGFQGDGTNCEDVNECALRIHNCISRQTVSCENTIGGFTCLCSGVDCTGSCVRNGNIIPNRQSLRDGCRNCTCIDGELTCRKITCDCNDPNVELECCGRCRQQNCVVNGTIVIRPGATWVNPERTCERCSCRRVAGFLMPQCVDLSQDCPPLNCPDEFQVFPSGKCCPVCQLPQCNDDLEGRVARMRNGCRTCTCLSGVWTCANTVLCGPPPDCDPTDILFLKDNCCPICRQQALNLSPAIVCPA